MEKRQKFVVGGVIGMGMGMVITDEEVEGGGGRVWR